MQDLKNAAMTEAAKRGGAKPKSPSGVPMKLRSMRWDDSDWSDARLIGMDRVRELVRQDAAKKRAGSE